MSRQVPSFSPGTVYKVYLSGRTWLGDWPALSSAKSGQLSLWLEEAYSVERGDQLILLKHKSDHAISWLLGLLWLPQSPGVRSKGFMGP